MSDKPGAGSSTFRSTLGRTWSPFRCPPRSRTGAPDERLKRPSEVLGSRFAQPVEPMGCGMLKVACDDGFEVVTKDRKELTAVVGWHLEHTHHKKAAEAEILAMAKHP